MYLRKSQIPELKALTKTQRNVVASMYHRKRYSWKRNRLPQLILIPLTLCLGVFLTPHTEWGFAIAFGVYLLLKEGHELVLTVMETNELATSPDVIEAAKESEVGF